MVDFFAGYHGDQATSGPETILPSLSLEVGEFCFKRKKDEHDDSVEVFSLGSEAELQRCLS